MSLIGWVGDERSQYRKSTGVILTDNVSRAQMWRLNNKNPSTKTQESCCRRAALRPLTRHRRTAFRKLHVAEAFREYSKIDRPIRSNAQQ